MLFYNLHTWKADYYYHDLYSISFLEHKLFFRQHGAVLVTFYNNVRGYLSEIEVKKLGPTGSIKYF